MAFFNNSEFYGFKSGRYSLLTLKLKPFIDAIGSNIKGKVILDVGAYNLKTTKYFAKQGADVYACEPDTERANEGLNKHRHPKEKVFLCTLQEMPKEQYGKFDYIIIPSFSITPSEFKDFFSNSLFAD